MIRPDFFEHMVRTALPPDTIRRRGSRGRLPFRESGSDWRREIYAGGDSGLPDMPMLGRVRYGRAYPHLPEHVHCNSFEICLLEKGRVDWLLERQLHELRPGEIFVSWPGEFHGGRDSLMQPCELTFVQISENRLVGADPEHTVTLQLLADLRNLKLRHIRVGSEARRLFHTLIAERRHADRHTPIILRAMLNQLLALVIRSHENENTHRQRMSPGISRASAILVDDWRDPPTISELARLANLGRSQFLLRFRQETGQTPGKLCEEQRLAAAKQSLIAGGISITAIAMQLGFSTSQYFATWFRRLAGFSPREYRQQCCR